MTRKQGDMHHSMHNMHMATLFNNYPYIKSSGMQVGTKFTATYVGMVVEYVAISWSAYLHVCMLASSPGSFA